MEEMCCALLVIQTTHSQSGEWRSIPSEPCLSHNSIQPKWLQSLRKKVSPRKWVRPRKMSRPDKTCLCRRGVVLVGSRRGTRVLHDEDSTSIVVRSRKRLNTLAHYKVPDGASLALQARQLYATSAKNGTVKQHNGILSWHQNKS